VLLLDFFVSFKIDMAGRNFFSLFVEPNKVSLMLLASELCDVFLVEVAELVLLVAADPDPAFSPSVCMASDGS
jgi:hypothetical protein